MGVINPKIDAEVDASIDRIEELDELLLKESLHRDELPWGAAHLGGPALGR